MEMGRIESLFEAYRSKRALFEYFAADYASSDPGEARRQSINLHQAEAAMFEALVALRAARSGRAALAETDGGR